MVFEIVQAQDIFYAFADSFEQDLVPCDRVVDLAILIEIFERASVTIIHQAGWDAWDDIVIVHKAVGIRAKILIEMAGKIIVTDTRLTEGIQPIDRIPLSCLSLATAKVASAPPS